jgi:hypothetical protein
MFSDDIFVDIQSFPISSAPPYQAASYTWGSPVTSESAQAEYARQGSIYTVAVYRDKDGQNVSSFPRISVKENLAMFLGSLKAASRPVPYLWIDAICINQSDRAEQASQVSMMTDIYSRCTQVIVWLGSGHDSTTSTQRFFDIHTLLYH